MSSQNSQPNMGRGQTCVAGASLSKVYAAKLGCIHKMGDVRDYSAQNGEGGDAFLGSGRGVAHICAMGDKKRSAKVDGVLYNIAHVHILRRISTAY